MKTLEERLLSACAKGQEKAALKALAAGANPNAMWEAKSLEVSWRGFEKARPLALAAGAGMRGVVNALIKAGADLDARGHHGFSALHSAVPHPGICQLLLDSGAKVDPRADGGSTPLLRACSLGGGLMAAKAGATKFGVQATSLAAAPSVASALDAIRILLEAGADPNAKDLGGRHAVSFALGADDDRALSMLIGAGADIHAVSGGILDHSISLLEQACRYGKQRCLCVLIKAGARIEDGAPKAALYWAVCAAQPGCVKALLDAGAKMSPSKARSMLGAQLTATPRNFEHIDVAISMYEALVLASRLKSLVEPKKANPSKRL